MIGNIISCLKVCGWLRWSLHHLLAVLTELLKKNRNRLLKKYGEDREIPKGFFPQKSIMQEVWNLKDRFYITSDIAEELSYVRQQILEHRNGVKRWERPLSHIVQRSPDGSMRQDASTSWGMGGGSGNLGFWFQLSWLELSPTVWDLIQAGKLHINVLELAVAVVAYWAGVVAITAKHLPWQPSLADEGDNSVACHWYQKFSNCDPAARRLTNYLLWDRKTHLLTRNFLIFQENKLFF